MPKGVRPAPWAVHRGDGHGQNKSTPWEAMQQEEIKLMGAQTGRYWFFLAQERRMDGKVEICGFCIPGVASLPSSDRRSHLTCGEFVPCSQVGWWGQVTQVWPIRISTSLMTVIAQGWPWSTHKGNQLLKTFIKPIRKAFIVFLSGVLSFKDNACLELPVTIYNFRWRETERKSRKSLEGRRDREAETESNHGILNLWIQLSLKLQPRHHMSQ